MLIEWEFQKRRTSKYRNISEWMLPKRGMGNGVWEIENGKSIVLFLNRFCAKIREKRSVLRAWCLLVFSEGDQTPHRGPDFCFYTFTNSLIFFSILS